MLWRVTLAVAVVCAGSMCSCLKADLMSSLVLPRDYGVKLCGREFIRAVIFTCGGSRWRRSLDGGLEPHHWSSFTAESARHIWQRSEQLPDDLPPLNAAASSSSSSSLADLLALFGATGDTQQHVFIPTPMESQTIPVLPEEEESKGASDWPALKKRSFSLGVAGICCTQGCTKNDIGHLC
ncbi:relaxin-3-like isoform X2 [Gouania willdenowi]|uniref:Insulin-like domain-containing protein n=1 Tax=Gouania willdenowi TaxID=441366 RepID=A0A8C5EV70_GOUWI|nr:plasminogen receptor (KT) isoform X2 [Gouania willdenowi]